MSKSKVFCCVHGCNSCASRDMVSFHFFPKYNSCSVETVSKNGIVEKVDIRKIWEKNLKCKNILQSTMRVCSEHFEESDFFRPAQDGRRTDLNLRRRRLKRTAVPTKNLPQHSCDTNMEKDKPHINENDSAQLVLNTNSKSIKKEEETDNKKCKDNMTESLPNTPAISETKNESVKCGETQKVVDGNKIDGATKRTMPIRMGVLSLNSKAHIKSNSKDNNNMCKKNKSKRILVKAATLKRMLPGNIKIKKPTIRSLQTVAVQTESREILDEELNKEDIKQESLRSNIDFLKKNIVGQIHRFEGSTFKINECIIKFTKEDEDFERTEEIAVGPDKVFSSCKFLSDYLRNSDRMEKSKSYGTKEKILNDFIEETQLKSYGIKAGHPSSEEIPDLAPQFVSVELKEHSDFEYDIFNDTKTGIEIRKSSLICSEVPHKKKDSPNVIDRNSTFHHKESKRKTYAFQKVCPECSDIFWNNDEVERHLLKKHRTVLKKTEYECEFCPKKFITFKSLNYHINQGHNLPTIEDVVFKVRCKYCSEILGIDCHKQHLTECQKKYEEGPNKGIEPSGTKVQDTTPVQGRPAVTKRQYPLMVDTNDDVLRKLSKLCEETDAKTKYSSPGKQRMNEISFVYLDD